MTDDQGPVKPQPVPDGSARSGAVVTPTRLILIAFSTFILVNIITAIFAFYFISIQNIPTKLLCEPILMVSQLGFILTCIFFEKHVGSGVLRAGLGWNPIQNKSLLFIILLFYVFINASWLNLFDVYVKSAQNERLIEIYLKSTFHINFSMIGSFFAYVLLAPIWEELFFRGWLWVGLQKWWPLLPVSVITSIFWLIAHISEGWDKVFALIPAAIMLSIVRGYCGSCRASLFIHSFGNFASILFLILLHYITSL